MDFLLDALALTHPAAAMLAIVALLALIGSLSAAIGAGIGLLAMRFIGARLDRIQIGGETDHGF